MENVVTLTNLADGAAVELFQSSLDKVLSDILDPNTDPDQVRSVRLEVQIKPNTDRDVGDVILKCSAKLAGMRHVETVFYLGRHKGHAIAVEHDPKQSKLFDGPPEMFAQKEA